MSSKQHQAEILSRQIFSQWKHKLVYFSPDFAALYYQ